jgi:anti-sigma regulatory factor (Ser/Thr protein kinase)
MTQLRMGLRAYALNSLGPAATLAHVNRMSIDLQLDAMATLLYAELDLETHELRVANAGHPPPVLVVPQGAAAFLDAPPSPPIGVWPDLNLGETVHALPEDSTLILFTDGLVERRDAPIDEGLDALLRVTSEPVADLEDLCARITAGVDVRRAVDDVALLVVRTHALAGRPLLLKRSAAPMAVADVRRALRRWLRANGVSEDDAFDIVVACTEAQTNAVLHAYRHPEGSVEIDASIEGSTVTIVVRDRGSWREREPEPALERPLRAGGRGLPLIHALADDTEVRCNDEGTEVRMQFTVRTPAP